MICNRCFKEIDPARAQAIDDFDLAPTCVKCSKVSTPLVYMSFDHKTGGTPLVVPTNPDGTRNAEIDRKAKRCHDRKR